MINAIDETIYNLIFKLLSTPTTFIMTFISHLGSATILILICIILYILLKDKKMAKGYCLNHKCFISKFDLKEKDCNNRHCKHFCKNVELFC